jgi:hypothetical protein
LLPKFDLVFLEQEWPEEVYPPYANGPGYVISSDIAQYIVSEFDSKTLRVSTLVNFLSVIGSLESVISYSHAFLDTAIQDGRC